jgi:hypothetical protein
MASPSSLPSGSRPSVSTVNDTTTGTRLPPAARTTPTASAGSAIVTAVSMSTSVSPSTSICREW